MIKLKISFGENKPERSLDITEGELLSAAVERVSQDIPRKNHTLGEMFNAVVNGHIIDPSLWETVKLVATDEVLVTPRYRDGDASQMFKQALLMTITIAAVAAFPAVGAAAFTNSLIVAGITIGATLALNALIPPPVQDLGNLGSLSSGAEGSQMYSVSGQSNQAKRLGNVPKVYGSHRMFPTVAANPYTELSVDPMTGETVQYLNCIYDFGLGSPLISDIKIGDTELTTASFTDFEYRLVDPNRPDTPQDEFDEVLSKEFKLYRGDRSFTQLSVAMTDGSESVQNTADNPSNYPAEIGLDFVCPRGLYAYSSGGTLGERTINLNIEFAPVGTSDWKAYNDITAVDYFSAVGGTDYTDFKVDVIPLLPSHPLFSTYYYRSPNLSSTGTYYDSGVVGTNTAFFYLKFGGNKLLFPKPTATDLWQWNVGTKILRKGSVLGIISAVTDLGPTYPDWVEVTLDRTFSSWENYVYSWAVNKAYGSGVLTYLGDAKPLATWTMSRHTAGVGAILGSSTTPVYASFKFRPKIAGQYKVRVRRTSTTGLYNFRVGDDLTWGALTTHLVSNPIQTTKRHVFLELRIKATDQLNGQIQNLSALVSQPVEVYDSGTATWTREITNNPAWIFCDLLTNEVNKKAVAKSRLHMDSILAWAAYCAEVPTPPPGGTYLEPRFQCNFILDYATTLQEVIGQVCGSAQASLNIVDGKYGVLVDKLKTTPVQIFTPRNSRDFTSPLS